MFNTTRRMSTPNTVEARLQDLGAEPLFSSVNDPFSGSPTSPNDIKTPPATYSAQQHSNTSADIIASLVQRLNEQTQQVPNEELTISAGSNPISILNEIHQREKKSSSPPKYSFTVDITTGRFHCQLEIFGKVFKTEHPTIKKQQAKEDAALLALRFATNEKKSSDDGGAIINTLIENRTDTVCKSEIWYRKQSKDFPTKQFRVILLEFCQMHHLPSPKYQLRNDDMGKTVCDCIIGDRTFLGDDESFIKANEAKDYVAKLAFSTMYKEFCEVERSLIRKRQGNGQETRSLTNTNFIESHTPSNPISSLNDNSSNTSKISPNHLLLTYDREVPNIKVEESHVEIPNIKLEEGSMNSNYSNSYSKRNQHQFTPSSTTSFHPYQRPSKHVGYKKFTSLLYEMAQSERWMPPDFSFENGVNGFVCLASINNYLFRGKACPRKMDAKESAAEEAYDFLVKHYKPPQRQHSVY